MIQTHLQQMMRFVMLLEYGKKLPPNYYNQFEDMNEDF